MEYVRVIIPKWLSDARHGKDYMEKLQLCLTSDVDDVIMTTLKYLQVTLDSDGLEKEASMTLQVRRT